MRQKMSSSRKKRLKNLPPRSAKNRDTTLVLGSEQQRATSIHPGQSCQKSGEDNGTHCGRVGWGMKRRLFTKGRSENSAGEECNRSEYQVVSSGTHIYNPHPEAIDGLVPISDQLRVLAICRHTNKVGVGSSGKRCTKSVRSLPKLNCHCGATEDCKKRRFEKEREREKRVSRGRSRRRRISLCRNSSR